MNEYECMMQPCEYVTRWTLEHHGFIPTRAKSCKAHLSDAVDKLITDNHGGVVTVLKWGVW